MGGIVVKYIYYFHLGGCLMKKRLTVITLVILMLLVSLTAISCSPKPDGIKVTIDLQDGTAPMEKYVQEGTPVELPTPAPDPYKAFLGWYTTPDATSYWNTSTPITQEITIYACWRPLTGSVRFDYNYAGAPAAVSTVVTYGEQILKPQTDPSRDCWEFLGWFTDKEATNAFNFDEAFASSYVTLYAGWKLEDGHTHNYTKVTTPAACTSEGFDTNTCLCGDSYIDNKVVATGHAYNFTPGDYFEMVTCSNNACKSTARQESLRIYDTKFVYEFDADKQAAIDARYQEMLTILESLQTYDKASHGYVKDSDRYKANKAFEEIYNAFYDDLNYLIEQYQYAYVFYCVDENDENTEKYETISEYRTNKISDFYALYRLIYETEYREYFFALDEGWTEEEIQEALVISDSYGNDEYKEINDRIDEIEIEFREIDDPSSGTVVSKLYEEFVKLNNEIAKLAGYDNYIDYAYATVYNRDYTPDETKQMREFVKRELKSTFLAIYNGYRNSSTNFAPGSEASLTYSALLQQSIFDSKEASDLVKGYFEELQSLSAGEKEIDFYKHANDLFKNGNYYTGKYEGAFSYWIGAQDTSILYFGPGSYSGAFTFVHEFGHYYQNVYNPNVSTSYDLDEIHSQANEMLFLAYLEDTLDASVLRDMYSSLYYDNLFNMVAIVMLATAIDEFEYCVYTNTAPDGTPTEYTFRDYDNLFRNIMTSYGINGILNSAYWRYVVIEAPCYYISYAMSAIPCLELLSVADTQGFDEAKDIYLKFFTFTDVDEHVEVDSVGDKIVKISFADTLEYAGLHSVFEEEIYTNIKAYFAQEKDFTYSTAE